MSSRRKLLTNPFRSGQKADVLQRQRIISDTEVFRHSGALLIGLLLLLDYVPARKHLRAAVNFSQCHHSQILSKSKTAGIHHNTYLYRVASISDRWLFSFRRTDRQTDRQTHAHRQTEYNTRIAQRTCNCTQEIMTIIRGAVGLNEGSENAGPETAGAKKMQR